VRIKIGSIVWGARDVQRAVNFWTQALDYKVEDEISDDWAKLVPRNGIGIQLSIKLTTSNGPKRHHIDLFTDDRKKEVERLIALGAKRKENWNYEENADYCVLVDTEGNTFDVVQK
jgi:predicted enzyme related to lactoylglutathione lyase